MPSPQEREAALFALALKKPVAERAVFLQAVCGEDKSLRLRLESMLADEPPDEAVGQTLGRYKLLERLGEGGCGVVYVAEQTEPVRRRVALKVIKLGMDTKKVVARFEAERQALAMMDHPNIARVFDAGTTETGRPYFVMELVRGIHITDYCDQANLSTKDWLDLFVKVCHAIQHAHQKGIIHRDIKPSNILVTLHDGVPVPKVIDFGIAKATESRLTDATVYTQLHQFIGTPAYMSPEQAEMSGLDIDTRSDIYSLGVLLYELLAGSTPFDTKELLASGIDAMRKTIREKEPVRPSTKLSQTLVAADVRRLSSKSEIRNPKSEIDEASSRRLLRIKETITLLRGDLDWIVMKCLEKDRARRYDTANGLAADLKRHLNNEPVVARPPSNVYRFQKLVRRNKLAFAAVAAVATVLVLGVIVSTWQAVRARRAENVQSGLYEEANKARANEAVERHKAETAREQTETNAKIARQNLYAADMSLAQQALQANNLGRARRLLDRHRPKIGEQDLRGWEWRYLWQQCRSRAITTLARHTTRAISVSFSADSKLLAVSYRDGRLEVWDVPSQKLAFVLKTNGLSGPVRFAPRGRLLVQPGEGATLHLYDLASGESPVAIKIDGGDIRAFSFSRDGSLIICFTSTSGLKVVDVGRREIIATNLPSGFTAHQPGGDVRISPGGARCFKAIDRSAPGPVSELSVGVFRPQEDVLEHEFMVGTDQRLSAMDLSPDGQFLATGTGWEHSSIRVWNALTFEPIARLDAHTAWIPELTFSPDSRILASASGDQTIRLWDTQTWQELAVLRGHGNEVLSVAFSPDGKLLASGAKDGEVLLWSATATPSAETRFAFPSHVHSAAILPGESSVLTLSTNGVGSVWGVPSLTETPLPLAPNSIQFFWPPNYLGGYDQTNSVRLYAVQHRGARLIGKFPVGPQATRIQFSAEERTLVWRDNSGQPQRLLIGEESATTMQTRRGHISPDGKLEALPSEKGVATLRERATKRTVMELRGHLLAVDGVAFTPDGKRLATTSGGTEAAKLWDTATGQELLNLPGHGMNLYNAEFSEDGNMLLAGWLGAGFWQLWHAPPWAEIEKIERDGGGWPRAQEP